MLFFYDIFPSLPVFYLEPRRHGDHECVPIGPLARSHVHTHDVNNVWSAVFGGHAKASHIGAWEATETADNYWWQ